MSNLNDTVKVFKEIGKDIKDIRIANSQSNVNFYKVPFSAIYELEDSSVEDNQKMFDFYNEHIEYLVEVSDNFKFEFIPTFKKDLVVSEEIDNLKDSITSVRLIATNKLKSIFGEDYSYYLNANLNYLIGMKTLPTGTKTYEINLSGQGDENREIMLMGLGVVGNSFGTNYNKLSEGRTIIFKKLTSIPSDWVKV